jgi:hypothetical protein
LVFLVDLSLETFFEYGLDDFFSPEVDKMTSLITFLESLIEMVVEDKKIKIFWDGFK